MPRRRGVPEMAKISLRLAVRYAVNELCADPEKTFSRLQEDKIEDVSDPIEKLVLVQLNQVYEQIQDEVQERSDAQLSETSPLRFLKKHEDETAKDIVQRFEKRYTNTAKEELSEWRDMSSPLLGTLKSVPVPEEVPPLDPLTSSNSSSPRFKKRSSKRNTLSEKSSKRGTPSEKSSKRSTPIEKSSISLESSMSSASPSSSHVHSHRSVHSEIAANRRKETNLVDVGLQMTPKTIDIRAHADSASFAKRPGNGPMMKKSVADEVQNNEQDVKPAEHFIPTVPSAQEVRKSVEDPLSSSRRTQLSQRSEDKMTCRYVPPKISSREVAVDTASLDNEPLKSTMVDVATNTSSNEGNSRAVEGSSSSNTTSDLSAGQLPQRLFDMIFRRPSLKIITMRPDGSIVPRRDVQRDENIRSEAKSGPSVHDWVPTAENGSPKIGTPPPSCAETEEGRECESVSAAGVSRHTASEDESNTMANISPLPKQT